MWYCDVWYVYCNVAVCCSKTVSMCDSCYWYLASDCFAKMLGCDELEGLHCPGLGRDERVRRLRGLLLLLSIQPPHRQLHFPIHPRCSWDHLDCRRDWWLRWPHWLKWFLPSHIAREKKLDEVSSELYSGGRSHQRHLILVTLTTIY